MYLDLFQYIEGDETADAGEHLGTVILDEDDVRIDLDDDKLAEELEQLFSEPIAKNDALDDDEEEVEPYTPEFFKAVLPFLPDYGIRGIIREDDEVDDTKRTIHSEEEETEEPDREIESMSSMGIISIDELSEDYEIAGSEDDYFGDEEEQADEDDDL